MNCDECYFLEDIGLFPKSGQIFEKLAKARCNLDRFRRKWDGQKIGKCPIFRTSLQGDFRGSCSFLS